MFTVLFPVFSFNGNKKLVMPATPSTIVPTMPSSKSGYPLTRWCYCIIGHAELLSSLYVDSHLHVLFSYKITKAVFPSNCTNHFKSISYQITY